MRSWPVRYGHHLICLSATAAVACIATWETDFLADLPRIDVRVLVIEGDADRILPYPKHG